VNDPQVRLAPEPGEPWAVWCDRDRQEILLNIGYFGLMQSKTRREHADAIADIGAALILHLREHPGASDGELLEVARAARPDHAPDNYW
jgi:hypothetical protein